MWLKTRTIIITSNKPSAASPSLCCSKTTPRGIAVKIALQIVFFDRESHDMNPKELEAALEEKAKNKWWILSLFLLTSSPGVLNSMHISSYVYLAELPDEYWCQVPELSKANWTDEQIRNISESDPSAAESCSLYNWNYTTLAAMGFDAALAYTSTHSKPALVSCSAYTYVEDMPSMVSEWNLVCSAAALRSIIQVSVAIGKFIGSFCFGMFADKFGRRKVYIFCCILYIVSSPAAALCYSYWLLLLMRVLIGVSGAGVFGIGYTILSEMTLSHYRTSLGCLYNISYAFGTIILPILAYYSSGWRNLQILMSIPGFLLLIQCWFIPESPRWYINHRKYKEAWEMLKGTPYKPGGPLESPQIPVPDNENTTPTHSFPKKVLSAVLRLFKLFSTHELRKRIIICHIGWFVAAMGYYALAINGTNFSANKYWYVALNGLVEAPGYLIPIVLLYYIGRKISGILLFLIGGIALLLVLAVPSGTPVIAMALIGRLCMSAVYAEIILHTSELFPTSIRNTAIGTSLTMAQLGTILSPFIVDFLGAIHWSIPSTVCGIASLFTGSLVFFLPETRNKPMLETIEELDDLPPDMKTSFRNCCKFE